MAVSLGDIKLLTPPLRRLGTNRATGQIIAVYEVHFSIAGQGDYVASVPVEGFSAALLKAAIDLVATPVIDTINLYE